MRARVHQCLPDSSPLSFFLHPLARGAKIELDAVRNFLTFQNFRGRFKILKTRVHAGDKIGFLDRDFLAFHFRK